MPLPTDPLLSQQWHLGNTGGLRDLNVRGVWNPLSGPAYTGAGVRVLVVDDGFDYLHPDLVPNWNQGLDFDFDANDNGDGVNDLDPFGNPGDAHGTAVAGIIGADNNGTGAVGVAFDVELVGYRVHAFISDGWLRDIRDSIHFGALNAQADVINISQGIANDATSEFGFGYDPARFTEIETAIGTAVTQGRGGLGSIIVKSAGNSRNDNYDVNADDWTNDTRQVVVAAVNQDGFVSSYSSYGAALLVSGFGTPGEVVTTDRTGAAGYNGTDFTSSFNGTSSAAPMVSGVVALMLEANPNLGWRDVQTILAYTAVHVGSNIGAGTAGAERYAWGWNGATTWNGGGLHFSNDYGYGLVDALAAVRLAETWTDTQAAQASNNEFTNTMDMLNVATVIPDGNATGLTFTGSAGFADEVDRVTVRITFSTTWTADMEIYLISPTGTVSELIDDVGGSMDFNGTWTFESQAFRGERANGTWSVRIVDDAGGDVLTVSDIVVRTYGRFSSSDRYVFTNEYGTFGGVAGHNTVNDTNGGRDAINASAVSSNSIIDLRAGAVSTIAGKSLTIVGETIEDAYGGDGNDTITGNTLANRLVGGRGNDRLNGKEGADTLVGGFGNDIYILDNAGDVIVEVFGQGTDEAATSVSYTLQSGVSIEKLTTMGSATTDNINLGGNSFVQTLIGNAGNNRLDGRGGGDKMYGMAGNDLYIIRHVGDITYEVVGGGTDEVSTGISYALVAGQEIEKLSTFGSATTDNINLTGNEFAQSLIGNAGNNRLDGKGGADKMYGNGGNDLYIVDNAGDQVFEAVGGGTDEVATGVTYALLGGQEIEKLGTLGSATTTNINLTGNEFGQTLVGNAGNNRLDGKGGVDKMYGNAGNDLYIVDNAGDLVFETVGNGTDEIAAGVSYALLAGQEIEKLATLGSATTGNFNLTGNEFNQSIVGNAGNNVINGKAGTDNLYGMAGADTFVFDTALGPTNIDFIGDFNVADDTIRLENAIFTGLAAGTLAASAFTVGASATTANHRIIYNSATGALFFDADGNGAGAAVRFATVSIGLGMTNADFVVV